MTIERIARHVEAHILRQLHRQILLRHRHDAACLAMDHRDGAAPIALPRDAPVAQAILDLALACGLPRGLRCELLGDRLLGVVNDEPVEEVRVDHRAVAGIGLVADREAVSGSASGGSTTGITGKIIGAREFEVALVVRGTAEDRARAVVHQNEIGDVDRQRRAVDDRMLHAHAGVEPFFSCVSISAAVVPWR